MKKLLSRFPWLAALLLVVVQPAAVQAYVGPGAGLTMLGSLWGLIVAVLFVVFGLLFLPFKLMRNRMKKKKAAVASESNQSDEQQQRAAVREETGDAGR